MGSAASTADALSHLAASERPFLEADPSSECRPQQFSPHLSKRVVFTSTIDGYIPKRYEEPVVCVQSQFVLLGKRSHQSIS